MPVYPEVLTTYTPKAPASSRGFLMAMGAAWNLS